MSTRLSLALLVAILAIPAVAADTIAPIPRVLPPEGLEIPADVRTRLETRLKAVSKRLEAVKDVPLKPDVEILTKAVELALLHREFYVEKDFAKAEEALSQAEKRLDAVSTGQLPWTRATGTVVRGYRSSIDGSAQPYGLVIPKDHDFSKPRPLYVWLHGRGDKNTDLHFIAERMTRPGQITPPGAIVVHPFGRHCVGWKHAGEIDVLEAVNSVKQHYRIDPDRVVLIGFSMGGAGAWHIGAHYTKHWVAVSPGAGFVDVARYQRIPADKHPADYVQKLWGLYDVPDYVRNLFNTNVIAYSGELDKQREAAVIMEEAFEKEGRKLTHLIGPGVEHAYEPETLKELLTRIDAMVKQGREKTPTQVHLQTRTLRYNNQNWLSVDGLEEHWSEARIDAEQTAAALTLKTSNVSRLSFTVPAAWRDCEVVIDGDRLGQVILNSNAPLNRDSLHFFGKQDGQWKRTRPQIGPFTTESELRKIPGAQGPIDDAFMRAFKVITPTGRSRNAAFQAWCDAELSHFKQRWRALMRADLPIIEDRNFDAARWSGTNLILWGDSDSNAVIGKLMATGKLPFRFNSGRWTIGEATFDGNRFVPQLIYPHTQELGGYLVLNSGLTFREAHDSTNSQQNPKLPDWAIIDITQPPDANAPGRIHDADFFDENWRLKRQPKAP